MAEAIQTRYEGPVETTPCRFGDVEVRVIRPSDPDRLLEADDVRAWNRSDDYMPYWAYLWPGAFLLAEAVASESWEPGTRALELGCGLGMTGLVGVARGLNVRFTDYDEAPLDFVARSCIENGFAPETYSTARFDWREPAGESYPVILGADVLYEARLVPLVVGVLKARLAPGGIALVAGPYRVATERLEPQLLDAGFRVESRPITSTDEKGQAVRGTVHRIWGIRNHCG